MKTTNQIPWALSLALAAGFCLAGCATKPPTAPTTPADAKAEINATNGARLFGTVADAAGQPIAGASLEFYQRRRAPADMEIIRRATSGANGAFEAWVPPGSTLVLARKPGLSLAWCQWSPGSIRDTELRFVLTPPAAVSGVVVDEADKPVPDAEVFVPVAVIVLEIDEHQSRYEYISGKPARDGFSARTGPDGKFRIEGFPTNATLDLVASKPGRITRETRREYVGPDTMLFHPGQQDARLVVETAARIEGRVTTADGSPLPAGVRLSAQLTEDRSAYREIEPVAADADGRFVFPSVGSGTFRIRTTFGTNAVPDWVADVAEVSVEAGQTNRDTRIEAIRGGFLRVLVLDKSDRQPVAAADVNAYRDRFYSTSETDTNGTAMLRLPPGEYRVNAFRANARSESAASATVETGLTNRVEIELTPPPKVSGVVRNPSGAPLPDVGVRLFVGYGSGSEVNTDAQGRYEIEWNPRLYGGQGGAPCLFVRDTNSGLALAQEIDESTATLDLKLVPGLVVTGKVTDESGQPIANATLRIWHSHGNSGSSFDKPLKSDAQGRFEIKALPPGRRYGLGASAKGYGSADHQIQEDDSGNTIELEPFVLRVADRQLAGQVLDADEKPVASAHVYIYGNDQPQTSVRSDQDGRFKFDAVCEGSIQVSASAQRSYGNARAEGGDTNVVVRLGQTSSAYEVEAPRRVSLKGKPLPDVAALSLAADAAPAGKPVLLCLLDVEQRPSRHFARTLNSQLEALRAKGLAVAGLQTAVVTDEAFKEWKDSASPEFPMGRVAEKTDATKWATEVGTLPWLILTDKDHQVVAEGFTLDELDAKVKELIAAKELL